MNLKSTLLKFSLLFCLSVSLNFVTTANPLSYCSPSFAFGCATWSNQSIQLGSINWNLTPGDCATSDYTTLSTLVYAGSSYSMTVVSGNWTGVAVYVDFNNDQDFDSTEALYHLYTGGAPDYTYTFNITIPANVPTGAYRMRVIAPWGSDGYTVGSGNGWGGCGTNYQYGNFDDFTLNVIGATGISNPVANVAPFISAYLNASQTELTVNAKNFNGAATIQVADITGKVIQTLPVRKERDVIDVSALSTGIYILHYADGVHSQSIRFVK
jgi:hypothetical protein